MNTRLIDFLRAAFPFLISLFLWRGAIAYLNPGGMLVLVPIFYYTFIRPVPWFAPFAVLMCFLLDYNNSTVLYWTAVWCLCYAANGFQTVLDLTQANNSGWAVFSVFLATTVFVLSFTHLTSFTNIARMIWTIAWICAMYMPITMLIKRVEND